MRPLAPQVRDTLAIAAERLRDAILPPVCLACERAVARHGAVCGTCWNGLRFLETPLVQVGFAFEDLRACVAYDDTARRLVSALKFADRTDLAPHMARWMARTLVDLPTAPQPVVVPVPLHIRRMWSRRYNQAAELARTLALETGLPFEPDTLTRIRATRQQVGLGAEEREDNVRGAFRIDPARGIAIEGRVVVLVDDVFTTGATLDACARALMRGGAERVHGLTFARVDEPT
ncbi:MAG: ComF family protein [Pseudomonadota bacterium]